jgi:primosomal protein N' (replication factor Y)
MPRIAKVVMDISLDREFDYLVPDGLELSLGACVKVPFGRSVKTGFVVGFCSQSAHVQLKSILGQVGDQAMIPEPVLKLAQWMAAYYCAPLEQAVQTVLPGAVRKGSTRFKNQLQVSLPSQVQSGAPSKKQQAVLDILSARGAMLLAQLSRAGGVSAGTLQAWADKGILDIAPATVMRNPLVDHHHILPTEPLTLMPEQAAALDQVKACMDQEAAADRPHVVLLHGVTGSGKTEVYLQAIAHGLLQNKGAIVLVPEISLTPQTIERFYSRFGKRLAVLHSHLSDGERHDEWHRIRRGEASIVIGARSAVFAPVHRLGVIIVDEEHEPSYKQDESPRYHARDVAVMRGVLEPCAVVLGSATPAMESWRNAQLNKYRLASLPRRVDHCRMPAIRVSDMRVEAEKSGHVSVFSRDLLEAIRLRLDRKEQVILFLNRRGFATSLICPKCGFVAQCQWCSVSMTYHRADERLRCHICGRQEAVPARCPGCQDPAFKFAGIGTQRVEEIVKKCFPRALVKRMDTDTMTAKSAYDQALGDFRVGKTDILIGTQMIAKGLHFPNVTLVGVIFADLSLHIPDFRAGERTFQLLAQVAGRAGRGDVSGEVIIQTYTPFHPAVQAVRRMDYAGFCEQEFEARRELCYPPFAHLICLTFRGRSEARVKYCCEQAGRKLRPELPDSVMLSEPVPAPLAKAKGIHRYQIIMRGPSTKRMTAAIRRLDLPAGLPVDVVLTVDVDAVNLM